MAGQGYSKHYIDVAANLSTYLASPPFSTFYATDTQAGYVADGTNWVQVTGDQVAQFCILNLLRSI